MQEFIEVVFSRATKQDIIRFVVEVQRASERHKREEIVMVWEKRQMIGGGILRRGGIWAHPLGTHRI